MALRAAAGYKGTMNQVRQASAVIETPRLRLVPFAADDLDHLAALYGDPEVMGGRKLGVQSRAESAAWLTDYVAHWQARGFGMWSLRARAGGDFVGECGFRPLAAGQAEIELSYGLAPVFWGQGLGHEAAARACDFVFAETALSHVVAVTRADNAASRRILERLGFRPLAVTRPGKHEIARYRLARQDFADGRPG